MCGLLADKKKKATQKLTFWVLKLPSEVGAWKNWFGPVETREGQTLSPGCGLSGGQKVGYLRCTQEGLL